MNAQAEVTNQDVFGVEDGSSDDQSSEAGENSEASLNRESSEIAIKLVNAVKSMNSAEITHYEMVNSFNSSNELQCLFLFVRALPYNPIAKIYPETPFLFFKGVSVPTSFDLSDETAADIETFMLGQNSELYSDLRLHDLEQPYLDAYESAIRIYNDMVEKSRDSYHASVKLAKSQVIEVSAVFVCLIIILLTVIGIS
jgi:hypothetical protein